MSGRAYKAAEREAMLIVKVSAEHNEAACREEASPGSGARFESKRVFGIA